MAEQEDLSQTDYVQMPTAIGSPSHARKKHRGNNGASIVTQGGMGANVSEAVRGGTSAAVSAAAIRADCGRAYVSASWGANRGEDSGDVGYQATAALACCGLRCCQQTAAPAAVAVAVADATG